MNRAVAVTGRRPASLPWGYDEEDKRAVSLLNRLRYTISSLVERGYTTYYVGMAEGVDMYIARILFDLRSIYRDIEVIATIPYKGFARHRSKVEREKYYLYLSLADEVKVLYEEYDNKVIFLRNKYMVDNSDMVLAVYDNIKNGGTYNTLKYAKSLGREIVIEEV